MKSRDWLRLKSRGNSLKRSGCWLPFIYSSPHTARTCMQCGLDNNDITHIHKSERHLKANRRLYFAWLSTRFATHLTSLPQAWRSLQYAHKLPDSESERTLRLTDRCLNHSSQRTSSALQLFGEIFKVYTLGKRKWCKRVRKSHKMPFKTGGSVTLIQGLVGWGWQIM